MNEKDKKNVEDLLNTAKIVSGKKMPIVVHLPSDAAKKYAKDYLKGKRGYKNITIVVTLNEPRLSLL